MTKSSYYTGHEDLDKKLAELYERQVVYESHGRPTDHFIKEQDRLLEIGEFRDEGKKGN